MNPAQYIQAQDGYKKTSHELRLASSQENRLRFVAGLFWMDQSHDIEQRYRIDNLASSLSVRGWEDTIWLTQQERKDHDEAIFGELAFDFTDKLTGMVGFRHFRTDRLTGLVALEERYPARRADLFRRWQKEEERAKEEWERCKREGDSAAQPRMTAPPSSLARPEATSASAAG